MAAAQVNLLPSLKQDRLSAQRTRRLITGAATFVIIIAVAVPVVLLVVRSAQAVVLKRTQSSINKDLDTIKNTPDIITMLSIKDHLSSLPSLYQNRVLMSQLFTVLPTVTPQEIKLTALNINADGTISFSGTTPSYTAVDKFFTALQNADVKVDPDKVTDPGTIGQFSNLVLDNVGGLSGKEIGFTIKGQFKQSIIQQGTSNGQ